MAPEFNWRFLLCEGEWDHGKGSVRNSIELYGYSADVLECMIDGNPANRLDLKLSTTLSQCPHGTGAILPDIFRAYGLH